MDGHFVPNIVMGAPVLKSVHKNVPDIFMDCHMMVSEPAKWIKDIAEAGGASYTFHLEATGTLERLKQTTHSMWCARSKRLRCVHQLRSIRARQRARYPMSSVMQWT